MNDSGKLLIFDDDLGPEEEEQDSQQEEKKKKHISPWKFLLIAIIIVLLASVCYIAYSISTGKVEAFGKTKQEKSVIEDDEYTHLIEGEEPDTVTFISTINVNTTDGKAWVKFTVPSSSQAAMKFTLKTNNEIIGQTGLIRQGYEVTEMDVDSSLMEQLGVDFGVQEAIIKAEFVDADTYEILKTEEKDATLLVSEE